MSLPQFMELYGTEVSRVKPLGRLASIKLAGEGTCLPPGCRRRQPGGGDTKTEPPHFQKPYQYWSGVIGIGRQPG